MNSKPARKATLAVAAAMILYSVIICWTCHAKYATFGYDDFDLAIDAQTTWNMLHGSLESSIHRIAFLGNHMRLILFLLAPLYAVFRSPLFFLYLQTFALAFSALGIYLIASKHLQRPLSALSAIAFLIYTPLINVNLYEFHPVALAIPAMIFMFYFYEVRHFTGFAACALLALSCQENISLIIAMFSIYALANKRKGKWVLAPLGAGAIYFILAFLVIIPHFNKNTIQFYRLYGSFGGSIPEIMKYALMHPIDIFKHLATGRNILYINSLISPLGYLPLAGPIQLFPAIPVLAQRLLSERAGETTIMYHYQSEFIPFIFIAAVFGVKKLTSLKHRCASLAATCLLTIFPLMAFCMSGSIPRCLGHIRDGLANNPAIRVRQSLIDRIPADSAVVASFEFLPKLSNRRSLYSLHHIYTGHYTLSEMPYPTPTNISYVIFNTQDRLIFSPGELYYRAGYKNLQAMLAEYHWAVMENTDGILALRRGGSNEVERLTCPAQLPSDAGTNIVQASSAGIKLLGFHFSRRQDASSYDLTLYWTKPRDEKRDYDASVTIKGSGGSIIYQGDLAPGSRLNPPQSWPAGTTIADHHGITTSREDISDSSSCVVVSLKPLPGF